jgi:hypothetical protein
VPQCAVVASAAHPDLRPEDWPLLRHALGQHSVEASTAVWTDPEVSWHTFDLVVANGAWDHIHHAEEFAAWAQRVSQVVPVVNSPAVLSWNMDKHYLAALASEGVPTVPTTWVEPGDRGRADVALPDGEFVVKPAISGGGFETARYGPEEHAVATAHIGRLLAGGRTAMVQPYQSSVDTQGEVGLIYLGGRFSHAIHKNPLLFTGAGVQQDLWDKMVIVATQPHESQLDLATATLSAAERLVGPSTYARVDIVALGDGTPAILELELVDPALYLELSPSAVGRFAEVLAGLIGAA